MDMKHHCNDCPYWYVTKKQYPSGLYNITICEKYNEQLFYLFDDKNKTPHPCIMCSKHFSYVPYIEKNFEEVEQVTERLVTNKGQCVVCIGCISESNCKVECGAIDDCLDKLAEYETVKEDGRLLVLPCKLETTTYVIDYIWDYGEIGDKADRRYFIRETPFEYGMIDEFNKSVFLTREEAEKALGEMN